MAKSAKSNDDKPRKRRRADSASLLTWPGMVLVVLGEVAVRVSPSWFPWLAPFGLTYGLGCSLARRVVPVDSRRLSRHRVDCDVAVVHARLFTWSRHGRDA